MRCGSTWTCSARVSICGCRQPRSSHPYTPAAAPAAAPAEVTFTKLDAKGRLPVPLCPLVDTQLAAERDGDVLVVFLPGASASPRPGYDTPPLRVDARRRLLLGGPLRAQLGLPDNATVISRTDTERGVLVPIAAGLLARRRLGLYDAPRRAAATTTAASERRRGLTALPGGRLHPSPTAPTGRADDLAAPAIS